MRLTLLRDSAGWPRKKEVLDGTSIKTETWSVGPAASGQGDINGGHTGWALYGEHRPARALPRVMKSFTFVIHRFPWVPVTRLTSRSFRVRYVLPFKQEVAHADLLAISTSGTD